MTKLSRELIVENLWVLPLMIISLGVNTLKRCASAALSFVYRKKLQLNNALIMPHFDYCSPVWDCLSGYLSDKLQKLQNRAARIITKSPFDTSSDHLLSTLDWGEAISSAEETESLNDV